MSTPVSKRPRRKVRDSPDQPHQAAASGLEAGRSHFDTLPTELLQSIFEFAGPESLVSLNATAKPVREALDRVWTSASLSSFGHLQFTFPPTNWWFRSLLNSAPSSRTPSTRSKQLDSPAAGDIPAIPTLIAVIPSPPITRGKRKLDQLIRDWQGPAKFQEYLRIQIQSRLFAGSSCMRPPTQQPSNIQSVRPRIDVVRRNDEVEYFNLSFPLSMKQSLYVEITVDTNDDNLSFAIVDFADGGSCSVTFSPDAGAIIRERKIKDRPRQIVGAFFYALKVLEGHGTRGAKFVGKVGLYVEDGKLAFLREPKGAAAQWQSTGFCVRLEECFEKPALTPCIAFRDSGNYGVEVSRVSARPPIPVVDNEPALANKNNKWQPITWSHTE